MTAKTKMLLIDPFMPTPQEVEFAPEEGLKFYYKQLDCEYIEIVRPVGLTEGYCMVVDEEGLLKPSPVFNPVASILYGTPAHGNPIVGKVLIAKEEFTPTGIELVGLNQRDVEEVLHQIVLTLQKHKRATMRKEK